MGIPEFIRAIPIREDDGFSQYMAIDDVMGLMSLVQLGVLEVHTWGSASEDPEHPDLLVIDLDPDPAVSWGSRGRSGAVWCATRFGDLGLESFVKTTGGKGLHVCVPVAPRLDWNGAKQLCKRFAELIVRSDPSNSYVATISKQSAQRKNLRRLPPQWSRRDVHCAVLDARAAGSAGCNAARLERAGRGARPP